MLLMLLTVMCYTVTSLNDKYAVSKAKMNGIQMTFVMAAATAFFMLFTIPFTGFQFTFGWQSLLFVLLIAASKLLEFAMSAAVLREMSAFELKAWLGICLFMSYFTDIAMGRSDLSLLRIFCIAVTVAGLVLIAGEGRGQINYRKIVLPLVVYLIAKYGYGLIITGVNKTGCMSDTAAVFLALILLAAVLFPKADIGGLIKSKPKETGIVALAKLPNAAGLLLENAVIGVSMANYSFIQPMILAVLFVLSLFSGEKYSKKALVGNIICIIGICAFQAEPIIMRNA